MMVVEDHEQIEAAKRPREGFVASIFLKPVAAQVRQGQLKLLGPNGPERPCFPVVRIPLLSHLARNFTRRAGRRWRR